jgi:predicted ATPase
MTAGADPAINTPDQRVRVFVSSTLHELAEERQVVKAAITGMRLTPVMFELGARPHPPRDLYRAYLAQSDVFVGIYWQNYGWVAPSEIVSGLEDEYAHSGDRPKLIYIKSAPTREPRLDELLARVETDDRAAYKYFDTAEELGTLLADDLAVLLTERFTRASATPPPEPRPPRLPVPPTAMLGRDTDLADLDTLLRKPEVHLVSVVGSGGIGKTRLALEAARTLRPDAPAAANDDLDGVWFVDLSAVTDPDRWIDPVGAALGVRAEGTASLLDLVIDRLQGLRVLLVLDNFEQVLPAAPELGRLLAACTGLTVLVTSRSVLHLRGEHEVLLAPLGVPPAGDDAAESVTRSAAVQLFLARVREVRPGFALDTANSAPVAELCRRLDGIPLAIELAAAQLRLLSPAAVLRRLGDRLDLSLGLTTAAVDLPRRQQTLRATVEWSHSLLGPAEQTLFARLSVFAGYWTLAAAEATGSTEGDLNVLSTLASLVAQSLVTTDNRDDEPRFRMLGTVRSYAREQLAERCETGPTQQRLNEYLKTFVAIAAAALMGAGSREWSDRIDDEADDLRSAVNRALQADDAETVVRLSWPMISYFWSRGQLPALHLVAQRTAALPSAARLPAEPAMLLLQLRGASMMAIGQTRAAEPLLRRMVEAAGALGLWHLRAYGLLWLGVTRISDAVDEATDKLDEAAQVFREMQDPWGLAFTLSCRGQLALLAGDPAKAIPIHREGLIAAEAIDNDHLRAQLLDMLGLDAVAVGDIAGARNRYEAAAQIHTRILDQENSSYGLAGLAGLALIQQQPEVAARLLGAATHVREKVGVAVWPGMLLIGEALRVSVTGVIGMPAYDRATATGAHMRIAEAFAYGLKATARPATDHEAAGRPGFIDRWDRSTAPARVPWWTGPPVPSVE